MFTNPKSGEQFKFRSLVAAGGPSTIGRATNPKKTAEQDTDDLLEAIAAADGDFSTMVDIAARLDHRRLAAVAVHGLMETLAASATAATLTVMQNTEQAAQQRKIDRVADYVLNKLDQKTRTA